jgi:hypothetical protein
MSSDVLIPSVIDPDTQSKIEQLETWTKCVVVTDAESRETVYSAIKSVKSKAFRSASKC